MTDALVARLIDRAAPPLVGEGAHGTYLADERVGTFAEALNLEEPRRVEAMHLDYLAAGADLIQTNTFAANRVQLAGTRFAGRVWEINTAAARIARGAREVAGRPVLVAGTVGPVAPRAEGPPPSREEAEAAFAEQVDALLAGGVDLILIESQPSAEQAFLALEAVRSRDVTMPVIVHFSLPDGFTTLFGETVEEAATRLVALAKGRRIRPPELLGVNCGLGPKAAAEHLARLAALNLGTGLSAAPNAGPLTRVGGRFGSFGGPEAFAAVAAGYVEVGARLVGGCCGTTPAHVAALARRLKGMRVPPARVRSAPSPPNPGVGASTLEERLASGALVVSVELDPPRGPVIEKFLADAALMAEAGADLLNVGDSPMARVRMSALVAAHLAQRETGLEAILHFTTRDRNRMALQADLLSAHALGVRDILALTGDRPKEGTGRPVFELDSVGLLRLIGALNEGHDLAGNPLGAPTALVPGAAFNPNAHDLAEEVARLKEKVAAGARFVMTQPVYTPERLETALAAAAPLPPVLLGVMPLHSLRHALFLNREVPGVEVPEEVLRDLEAAGDRAFERGLAQAEELVAAVRERIAGVYVVLSFGKAAPMADLIRTLRRRFGRSEGLAPGGAGAGGPGAG